MSKKRLWYFIVLFLQFLTKAAYDKCKKQGQSLPPNRAAGQRSSATSTIVWTSNYIIDLGCRRNAGIYVELLPKFVTNKGLCMKNGSKPITLAPDNYTNNDFKCKWDHLSNRHPDALLNITDNQVLLHAMSLMDYFNRYWISDINVEEFRLERECEVIRPTRNRNRSSFEWTSFTYCEEIRHYNCVNNTKDNYRTAISLVRLPRKIGSCYGYTDANTQQQEQKKNNESSMSAIAVGVTVVVLFIILITSFLNKRQFSELNDQIKKLQQQGFNHPMYGQEPLQIIHESMAEPETPTTPDNPSLYVNSTMSRGTNITVSYLTSTQIQNTVAVTGNQIRQQSGIQTQIPLENHVEGDTVREEPNEAGLYSTVTRPADKNPLLQIPARDGAILHSNGFGALHNSMSYYTPNNRRAAVHNRQTSTEPSTSKPPFFPDTSSPLMQNEILKNTNFDLNCVDELRSIVIKSKPSPKPCIKHELKTNNTFEIKGAYGRQVSETKSEMAFYINTGNEAERENPDIDAELEDYEHIWRSKS